MIYHIAFRTDWEHAVDIGGYRISTRGQTLDEVGFIHCSSDRRQVEAVARLFYSDCTEPLCLLVIDSEKLHAEVIEEHVGDPSERFPHVYGPLNIDAVTDVLAFIPPT